MTAGAGWAEAPAAPEGLPYHRIHEAGRPGLWRPIAGILLMLLGFVAIGALVATAIFALVYAVTGQGSIDVARLADLEHPTPAGLAFLSRTDALVSPGLKSLPSWNTVRLEPCCAFRREATCAPATARPRERTLPGALSCPDPWTRRQGYW